jgi:Leucine-rich repeat (LRR) protein
MITNHIDTNLPSFKFSKLQRASFGQCHSFLLRLGVVLSLTWFPSVQAATDCAAVTEIPQVECEALVALYNSTDGQNWYDSPDNKWNVTDTPCSWTDVTCIDGYVTKIEISQKNLVGTIPSELGNLSQLTSLNLYHNQLSGSIPSELGNLSQMTNLSLGSNQLSGSIPSELGNLSQLTSLSLGLNQLSGSIPSELGNLSQLTFLDLNQNQLSGSIPIWLGSLSQLTSINLSRNQLGGSIPSELGNLGQLTVLSLHRNQLSGSIPSELGNLSQLTDLVLGYNQLSGSIPSELGNLSQLTTLSLWDSQLSGSIPSELGNLSQLRYLGLLSNQLSGSIPSELGNLSQLKNLMLYNNQLIGSIPSELGNLSQLTHFRLHDNQLSGSIPSELGNLSQLNFLQLYNNQLSGSIPNELGNLSQLIDLELNDNQLSGEIPPSLSNLSSLVENRNYELDLGYNHLTASDAGLISFLDIIDPDWAETQNLTLLTGCPDGGSISINPTTLDFGSEAVGDSISLTINTQTQDCGEVQVDTIEFTGSNASEFAYDKNKECYEGEWKGQTFSACQFSVVFSPTSVGTKDASISFTFDDANVQQTAPIPLVAEAVDPALPNLTVTPSTYDFGTVTIGRGPFEAQFTVENTGNVNLKFDTMALTGADASEFSFYGGCSSQTFLRPSGQCQFSAQLMPTSLGNKQADLNLDFGTVTKDIPLTGTVTEPADCSDASITTASLSDGSWDSPDTWDTGTIPTASDVVQIQTDHTITGIAFAQVKALCIEEGANLISLDSTALEIQATDYIQNKGAILGKEGSSETAPCSSKEKVGTGTCAYPGASVILKVGSSVKQYGKAGDQWWYSYESGGPIFNAGTIKAGNGGDGSQYAAPGGNAIVLGRDTTNTGIIQAGNGGNLTGTNSGEAGEGGLTQIWGKLGGPGHLYNQNGAQALAGNGGKCNTTTQTGGEGGNLWLVSLPDVHLSGGIHKAGMGDTNCNSTDKDGWVRIEPSIIDLSGADTVVSGGDIAIYGGNDWTLDLSNLSGTVINATGDITLAVGEGGTINMKGSSGAILQAGGQVQIFADNIVLDENVLLSDLVQATNIVVGPSKILREVSLTGAGKLSAEPEVTFPVKLILSNNGPEADTYTLDVINPANWVLGGQLPSTIEVKELDTVELVLNVTLPTISGATNLITVTAISQADSEVKASTAVQVAVGLENIITPLPTDNGPVLPADFECPLANKVSLNEVCKAEGQTITDDVEILASGRLSNAVIAGFLTNDGWVSNLTITQEGHLTGGIVTSYITNKGLMENFEFRGMSIIGGTLGGTIYNNSKVGGFLRDVQLAADAHIIGGIVTGDIQGDCGAPAKLENIIVKSGSHLSCVIIDNGSEQGDSVVLAEGVTFGQGVQFAHLIIPSETAEGETFPNLPNLSGAIAVNVQGETVNSNALFALGIAVNSGSFERNVTSSLSDIVDIRGRIEVDREHIGQVVDISIVIAQPSSDSALHYAMLDASGNFIPWDGNMGSLVPVKTVETSAAPIEVQIYYGQFYETGVLNFYVGYRLADGMVVYSPDSLKFTIIE